MGDYAVVGKRVPRIDAVPKVTGKATYAGDLVLPGMLHGKLLRSPYAHAEIVHIDTRRAEKLPGVRAVITGKDFPGRNIGFMKKYSDRPPLALGKVRYVGEAVAAVAAEDEDTAEQALELISVEYKELPAVLTAEEAMREGAILVNEGKSRNIAAETKFLFGDVEKAFQESDYVREETFRTQRISIGFIEPHAVLASVDASGKVTFQGSKQSPYITMRHLAYGLDIPLNKIRMINPYIGGAFSGKHDAHDLDFAAVMLSQKTGRPVRIVVSQSEIIGSYRQRHSKEMWLKLGVKKDGTLVAADCRVIAEGGAYLGVGPLNIYLIGVFLNLPYRLPNIRYEAYRVYTNKPICGAVRGQSIVVCRYGFESLLDMVAGDIGVDRVDIRLKNAIRNGDRTANGMQVDTSGLTECIERVAEKVGWEESRKKKTPYRGIGFACGSLPSGSRLGGHFGALASVNILEDGTAVLHHGGTELGQGIDTIMAQMVAEVLGLRAEDVQVGIEDSDMVTLDPGMFADRATFWTGNAVKAAAEDARRQLAEVAAEALQVPVEELEFRDRQVCVRNNPEKSLAFLSVLRGAMYGLGMPIIGRGTWAARDIELPDFSTGIGNFAHGYEFIAQAVEVEVDPETGRVKVLRAVLSDDAGQPINPMLLDGQQEGGFVFTKGQALYEECIFDERGQQVNYSFMDYKMPGVMEAPEFENIHVITNDPYGPFGAKGAGEASGIPALGAIANAVHDATGVRIKELPITPEKILEGLRVQKGGK